MVKNPVRPPGEKTLILTKGMSLFETGLPSAHKPATELHFRQTRTISLTLNLV